MEKVQLEQNIIESFRLVKSDVVRLQNLVAVLSQNQQRLLTQLGDTREKEISLYHGFKQLRENKTQKILKIVRPLRVKTIHKVTRFIASKNSAKFHALNCIFAKNIKPKSKIIFKSKNKALNLGFKACDCIKRV